MVKKNFQMKIKIILKKKQNNLNFKIKKFKKLNFIIYRFQIKVLNLDKVTYQRVHLKSLRKVKI